MATASSSYTIRCNRSHSDLFEHHFPLARNHRLQISLLFYRSTTSIRWTYTRHQRPSSDICCHCKEDHVSTNDCHSLELQQLHRPTTQNNSCHTLRITQPLRHTPRRRTSNWFQLKHKARKFMM